MFDKVKQYFIATFGFIIAGLIGAVYFLMQRNNALRDKNGQLEAESDLRNSLMKEAEEEKETNNAVDNYKRVADEYLKSSSDGSDTESK